MSSTLIKAYRVNMAEEEDARVIDSNQAVSDRLQILSEILSRSGYDDADYSEEFSEGLNAEQVDALFEDNSDFSQNVQPQSGSPGVSQEEIDNIIAQANAEAEAIINEANDRANQILNEAGAEAENIKADAYNQGFEEGSSQGYEASMAKTAELEADYNARLEQQAQELEKAISMLEPRFVKIITDIYSHFFKVDLTEKSKVVAHLVRDTIRNIEGGNSYFVHVSPKDYEGVAARREELMTGLASTCLVEIIEDISLGEGACFIETESGIYDCGIDTELELLKKELDLLSYTPNE